MAGFDQKTKVWKFPYVKLLIGCYVREIFVSPMLQMARNPLILWRKYMQFRGIVRVSGAAAGHLG